MLIQQKLHLTNYLTNSKDLFLGPYHMTAHAPNALSSLNLKQKQKQTTGCWIGDLDNEITQTSIIRRNN